MEAQSLMPSAPPSELNRVMQLFAAIGVIVCLVQGAYQLATGYSMPWLAPKALRQGQTRRFTARVVGAVLLCAGGGFAYLLALVVAR